ncbi:MAG: hypothetical protein M0036_13840 [Desulfobacteraceae bacterium]|nr:hypothetical protein [Desulfobacteraceae bacterium]
MGNLIAIRRYRFLVLAMAAILVAACGGGSGTGEQTGRSAVSFQVVWDRPVGFHAASLTDCLDVATVSAEINGTDGTLLGSGGPWSCSTGSGVIAGLPANRYATITVAGYGADGSLLYYGQNENAIFLTPGTVDGGVITAGPFVPTLLFPADASPVATNALELRWQRLLGATGYEVDIAMDNSFSGRSTIQQLTIQDGNTTSVRPDAGTLQENNIYHWRVRAVSGSNLLGPASAVRQFTLRALQITQVTFVDYAVVATPITETVVFQYASIDDSQTQAGATISHWSAEITPTEYFSLEDTITVNGMTGQGDILEGTPCPGSSGKKISFVLANGTLYEFNISSGICQSSLPPAVQTLLGQRDTLLGLYQP